MKDDNNRYKDTYRDPIPTVDVFRTKIRNLEDEARNLRDEIRYLQDEIRNLREELAKAPLPPGIHRFFYYNLKRTNVRNVTTEE